MSPSPSLPLYPTCLGDDFDIFPERELEAGNLEMSNQLRCPLFV